jgi:hypothetical protein
MVTAEDTLRANAERTKDEEVALLAEARTQRDLDFAQAKVRFAAAVEAAATRLTANGFDGCQMKVYWQGGKHSSEVAVVYLGHNIGSSNNQGSFYFAPALRKILTNPISGDEATRHHHRDVTNKRLRPDWHNAVAKGWLMEISDHSSLEELNGYASCLDMVATS